MLTGGGGDAALSEAATSTQAKEDGSVTFKNDSVDDLDFAEAGRAASGMADEVITVQALRRSSTTQTKRNLTDVDHGEGRAGIDDRGRGPRWPVATSKI